MQSRRPPTVCAGPILAVALAACGGGAPTDRPDVVLISLDTLRADRVSAWGATEDGRVTTPTLDALAARGVRFADASAPASQTAPSHVSLFTGLDPLAHGVRNASRHDETSTRVSDEVPMLSELFGAAGYYTGVLGDTGNVHPDMGFDRGFDHQVFAMMQVTAKLPQVEDFCDQVPDGAPAFLFFHTYQIHSPYLPPRAFVGRFSDPAYQGPFRKRYERLVGRTMSAVFGEAGAFLDTFEGLGDEDVAWLSDLYDENVLHTDAGVGRLLETWRARRGDDTVVIVLSDHGEEFMEHGSLGHRRSLHRVLTHVPLIVAGPGVAKGVVESPISLTGLPATLAEFFDLAPPHASQEPSFAAALTDPAAFDAARDAGSRAFEQLLVGRKAGFFEGVTTDRWHLVRASVDGEVSELMFDLDADPLGLVDVRAQHEAAAADLLSALSERRSEGVDLQARYPNLRGPRLSVQRQRELEALGYTE